MVVGLLKRANRGENGARFLQVTSSLHKPSIKCYLAHSAVASTTGKRPSKDPLDKFCFLKGRPSKNKFPCAEIGQQSEHVPEVVFLVYFHASSKEGNQGETESGEVNVM